MMDKNKICFVSFTSYPILSGTINERDFGIMGGAEYRQIILAQELVKHDLTISFISYDFGQKEVEEVNKIKIFKTYPKNLKSTFFNNLLKVKKIWYGMKLADADIYYVAATNYEIVGLYCILKNRKYICSISSDLTVSENHNWNGFRYFIQKNIIKRVIKSANCVIAQSEYQKHLLKENFGVEGKVIKNGILLNRNNPQEEKDLIVLWVGSIHEIKNPEIFIELAKRIPNAKFQMIGGVYYGDIKYYEQIKESAEKFSNINFLGFIPPLEIQNYFDKAAIFVNTSRIEGFPNTFLQAGLGNLPIVSLNVDPDEIICKNFLGYHSKNLEQMIVDIKKLLDNELLREKLGKNCRRYVEEEHDIQKIVFEYKTIFLNI